MNSSHKPVVISGDTHIAGAHTDFSDYFDPEYRPLYHEQRELAQRAAAVLDERRRRAGESGGSGTSSSGLLDTDKKGTSPFDPDLVQPQQAARHELLQGLGVEEWNEDDIMSVPREDDPEWRLRYLELDGTAASVVYPQLGFILGQVSDP